VGNRRRQRPVAGGERGSHFSMPIGTLGVAVIDQLAKGRLAVLSCNHVLAALNRARIGDPVMQPAVLDGGAGMFDICGTLARYIPVRFGWGVNLIDAAIATVDRAWPWVQELGSIAGIRPGNSLLPGDCVRKVGRTTGLTEGKVVATYFMTWVP